MMTDPVLMPKGVLGALYDYDGVSGNTEPAAMGRACDLANETIQRHTRDGFQYPRDEFITAFTGWTFRTMLPEIANQRGFELDNQTIEALVREEEERNVIAFRQHCEPIEGVNEAMRQVGGMEIIQAIVSSSSLRRLHACMFSTGQDKLIIPERVFSAQSSLTPPRPKPDPAIYLHALQKLGLEASQAVAIEDSGSGVKSAIGAGISVIGFVGALSEQHAQMMLAKKLLGLGAFCVLEHMAALPHVIDSLKLGNRDRVLKLYGPGVWNQ